MLVKDLLNDPSRWTRGVFAKDNYQEPVASTSNNAVCWCLLGAIVKCYSQQLLVSEITTKVREELGSSIMVWNDDPERTFEDVKNLVTRLNV